MINEWNGFKRENESLVISIDAPWGSGKSYLLSMWNNWLLSSENSNSNYATIYYNAWENDDFENAFIPLVYALSQIEVNQSNESMQDIIKQKTKTFVKSCAFAILKDGVTKLIGKETADIINKGLDIISEDKIESIFDKFKEYSKEKTKFKNSVAKIIPSNGKLIIFIDELDRSKPSFAIETLEIIKHYFNINNLVFVFAVDLIQLSHTVEKMYGEGMDSIGYLRRFFDINLKIPSCDIKDYLKQTYFQNTDDVLFELILSSCQHFYFKLDLSLRDIDKITNHIFVFIIFYKKHLEKYDLTEQLLKIETYIFFIILKYKFPKEYYLIINDEFITYDNQPKNWGVIDRKFFVSKNISGMLKDIQTGNAHVKTSDFISKYCIDTVNIIGLTFAEHIERTLEMFSTI